MWKSGLLTREKLSMWWWNIHVNGIFKTGLVKAPILRRTVSSCLSIPVSGLGCWTGQGWCWHDSLCLSVSSRVCVCVCVGVGRWRVLGVGKGVCVWWGKGDSKAFQEHESLETLGWSWVQTLAPAFQREIRSMVIRHLPLRQMGKEFAFLKTPACRDENQEETAGFPATPHPHPQGSWGPWWEVAFPWASVASATHCWFEHPGLFLRELFFTHLFEWFITKKSHSICEHWKLPWLSEEKWQREAGRQNRDVSFYLKEISMELKITENLKVCFTRMVAVL